MEIKYIYPRLPAKYDFLVFRVGGFGLANCLFVFSRAMILAKEKNLEVLTPTWLNFSLGPYLRFENDKRHYKGLFVWDIHKEVKKTYVILCLPKTVLKIQGLGKYFDFLKGHSEIIRNALYSRLNSEVKIRIAHMNFGNAIGVHVRLGDYPLSRRINVDWYVRVIKNVKKVNRKSNCKFFVFTDGQEDDVHSLLSIEGVQLIKGRSAIEDIWSLSLCSLIIASDSTFSAWGAFLGQVPIIFRSRHFGSVLDNSSHEVVIGDHFDCLVPFLENIFE